DESAPKPAAAFAERRRGPPPRRVTAYGRVSAGGCRDTEDPDRRLADLLPELMRHAPGPPPRSTRTPGAAAAEQKGPEGAEKGWKSPLVAWPDSTAGRCVLDHQDLAAVQPRSVGCGWYAWIC
ncbi:hypothetical protein Q4I30_006166, partial [Leishmania utingensis]